MNVETNKSAVREFFAAIDKAQNMLPLDQFAAPSYQSHFPGAPPLDQQGTQAYANAFFAACPGLRHTVHDIVGEGDHVAARITIRGTHTEPFQTPNGAIPPQNRGFEIAAVNWYRFEHGKVVDQHVAFDMLGFLQQIGATPS